MQIVIPAWALRIAGAILLLLSLAGAWGAYHAYQYLFAPIGVSDGRPVSRGEFLDVLINERFVKPAGQAQDPGR